MTYSSSVQTGAPLGVGGIVGESFSLLMRHFFKIVLLAIVPTLLGTVISGLLIGWGATLGTSEPVFTTGADFIPFGLSIIGQLVTYGLTTALLVQLAYDAKLERPLELGRYISPALACAVPIAVLGLVSGIAVALGMILVVIPGLWVYAVFSVMPAAVVIERVGFGGLGRSAALTKEYRWPILGAVILIAIINAVINFVAVFIVGLVAASMAGSGAGLAAGVIVLTAISAIGFGLSSISIALIYARLREIKEGVSLRDIVSVFD